MFIESNFEVSSFWNWENGSNAGLAWHGMALNLKVIESNLDTQNKRGISGEFLLKLRSRDRIEDIKIKS